MARPPRLWSVHAIGSFPGQLPYTRERAVWGGDARGGGRRVGTGVTLPLFGTDVRSHRSDQSRRGAGRGVRRGAAGGRRRPPAVEPLSGRGPADRRAEGRAPPHGHGALGPGAVVRTGS